MSAPPPPSNQLSNLICDAASHVMACQGNEPLSRVGASDVLM
jgi:hypothetical protein